MATINKKNFNSYTFNKIYRFKIYDVSEGTLHKIISCVQNINLPNSILAICRQFAGKPQSIFKKTLCRKALSNQCQKTWDEYLKKESLESSDGFIQVLDDQQRVIVLWRSNSQNKNDEETIYALVPSPDLKKIAYVSSKNLSMLKTCDTHYENQDSFFGLSSPILYIFWVGREITVLSRERFGNRPMTKTWNSEDGRSTSTRYL